MNVADQAAKTRGRPGDPQPDLVRAALWMGGAIISFSLVAVAGREAARTLAIADLIFYRSAIAFAVLTVAMRLAGAPFLPLKTARLGLHLARSCIHFTGQFAWFMALSMITLAEVFALEFTAPLWVALIAPLVLGERLTHARLTAVLLGFAGILILLRPGRTEFSHGLLLAVFCAVAFAGAILTTKLLTRTEAPTTIMGYMLLFQAALALVATGGIPAVPQASAWPWVLMVAVLSLTAHLSLVVAYRYGDAVVVAPMDFVRLPMIILVGMVFYAEPPDMYVVVGGATILAANLINIWSEARRHRSS